MYSDNWILDKSIFQLKSNKINSATNIIYWANNEGELVGVQINFNLANDVHYELEAPEWYRFLDEVLCVESRDNPIEALREFFKSSPIPWADLESTLYKNEITYKKMAFYDDDFDVQYDYEEPQEPQEPQEVPRKKMSEKEIKERLSGRAAEYLMFLDD